MSDLLRSAMPTPEIDSFMSAVSQAYDLSEDQINRLFLGKKQEKTGESPDLSLTPASSERIMAAKEKLIEFMIKIRSENDHKNSETRRDRRFYVIIGVSVLFVIAVVVITIILSNDIAVLFLGNGGVAATYMGFLIVALRQQTLWHRLDINAQLSQLMLAVITTIDDPKHAAALASVFRDQLNGSFSDMNKGNTSDPARKAKPRPTRG